MENNETNLEDKEPYGSLYIMIFGLILTLPFIFTYRALRFLGR